MHTLTENHLVVQLALRSPLSCAPRLSCSCRAPGAVFRRRSHWSPLLSITFHAKDVRHNGRTN